MSSAQEYILNNSTFNGNNFYFFQGHADVDARGTYIEITGDFSDNFGLKSNEQRIMKIANTFGYYRDGRIDGQKYFKSLYKIVYKGVTYEYIKESKTIRITGTPGCMPIAQITILEAVGFFNYKKMNEREFVDKLGRRMVETTYDIIPGPIVETLEVVGDINYIQLTDIMDSRYEITPSGTNVTTIDLKNSKIRQLQKSDIEYKGLKKLIIPDDFQLDDELEGVEIVPKENLKIGRVSERDEMIEMMKYDQWEPDIFQDCCNIA